MHTPSRIPDQIIKKLYNDGYIKDQNMISDNEISILCLFSDEKMLYTLYQALKYHYYNGAARISDNGFDLLENHLIKSYGLNPNVGTKYTSDLAPKYKHFEPMLSLSKIQVDATTLNNGNFKTSFERWRSQTNISLDDLYATPKYDGIAINLQYKNGKPFRALTRGDGFEGKDVSHLISDIIPDFSDIINDDFEIRGELVMSKDDFKNHFISHQQNPRNTVAGLMSKKVKTEEHKFIQIVIFDIRLSQSIKHLIMEKIKVSPRIHNAKYFGPSGNFSLGFHILEAYSYFKKIRSQMQFQLDGFVVATKNESDKKRLGESKHSPNWAIAIKFEAPEITTIIKDIEWNLGKSGEYTPVGILEPVDFDGSKITRVSLHNLGFMKKMNCTIGAEISLRKAGDIIPQVMNILSPGNGDFKIPKYCIHCEEDIDFKDGDIHLICENPNCQGKKEMIFKRAINFLDIDHIGDKGSSLLYNSGNFETVFDLLNPEKNNVNYLIGSGYPDGSTVRKISKQLRSIKSIKLDTIILMMGIANLGESTAYQLATWWEDDELADFTGLEKNLITEFTEGKLGFELGKIINRLSEYGIDYEFDLDDTKDSIDMKNNLDIKICLTGSPKPHFRTKKEFLERIDSIPGFNIIEVKIKDAEVLITDDLNSNTAKMKDAKKRSIDIFTYQSFLQRLKSK